MVVLPNLLTPGYLYMSLHVMELVVIIMTSPINIHYGSCRLNFESTCAWILRYLSPRHELVVILFICTINIQDQICHLTLESRLASSINLKLVSHLFWGVSIPSSNRLFKLTVYSDFSIFSHKYYLLNVSSFYKILLQKMIRYL